MDALFLENYPSESLVPRGLWINFNHTFSNDADFYY